MTTPEPPPWWTPEMPALCQRRAPLPDVARWQSTYVRYKGQSEGQVCQQGWEQSTSVHMQEQLAMAANGGFNAGRTTLHSPLAPLAINMRIVTAPAEFAVPVKQDRRLTPDFKVRVEVKYRGQVSFPLTVRAYILAQQEKDNLPEWTPEGVTDHDGQSERKGHPTELKGTTYITHHFEANMSGGLSSSFTGSTSTPVLQGNMGTVHHVVPSTVIQTPYVNAQGDMLQHEGMQMRYLQHQNPQMMPHQALIGQQMGGGQEVIHLDSSNPLSLTSGTTASAVPSLGDFSDSSNWAAMLQDFFPDGDVAAVSAEFMHNMEANSVSIKPEHISQPDQKIIISEAVLEEDGVLTHDFEFLNLEFMKPTRMSKVYACFACTVLERDLLYCIFHIPTVGICRAEQRIKACERLSIPRRVVEQSNGANQSEPSEATSGYSQQMQSRKRIADASERSESARPGAPGGGWNNVMDTLPASSPSNTIGGDTMPHSRNALREWILEEYESRGWRRRLTELDLQTLESQAGFPVGGGDVDVSPMQWEEFTSQFRDVLNLLTKISSVWNHEDPCVISGLDMDRGRTAQALAREPPGTFICRLSWSEPGSLVLTCKVAPGTPAADGEGLLHVIIGIKDLNDRRVDTWIRDYPAASHVLDVYTHKRVDKRKVFASNYTRLRLMDELEGSQG
ncbi:unnamed protein product [Ostreobium quekettii]|uniref:SH2 domain-containing protein n=1 Tax=Ostreobium quekettii TaxID=121088 RepID=A0A8S1J2L2_9CHLO|nr:unnamed protein product [Ostreobium quekettii]|eukprot:evm.model.scf_196.5 EVM.evm.TU.scf_196.5   scf_196:51647-58043(-)